MHFRRLKGDAGPLRRLGRDRTEKGLCFAGFGGLPTAAMLRAYNRLRNFQLT
jgi:hypothetical protein